MSRTPFENNFEDALYPHQRIRNLGAILLLIAVHLFVVYLLLYEKVELPVTQGEKKGELVFLNLLAENKPNSTLAPPEPEQPEKKKKSQPKKKQQQRKSVRSAMTKPNLTSPPVKSPAPPASISSQIAAAREKRQAVEEEALQQNQEAQVANASPSEDEIAMARIKANIKEAAYNRKGKNGIFQITSKGVQTGRFTFRGWDNDPRQSTWKSYEVDAGVGGDVELALIRRMISIIRENYSGDFNWESQRMGRVVVLSARPADTAKLEKFLHKEFFGSN
jgi:hypothetical protein